MTNKQLRESQIKALSCYGIEVTNHTDDAINYMNAALSDSRNLMEILDQLYQLARPVVFDEVISNESDAFLSLRAFVGFMQTSQDPIDEFNNYKAAKAEGGLE